MRVHPNASPRDPKTTRLSILDNLSARFGFTHAIFIYQTSATDVTAFEKSLIESLRKTLNDYSHFSGQLSWSPTEHGKGGRSQVTYGGGAATGEPGVGFKAVKLPVSASKFLPLPMSAEEEEQGLRVVEKSLHELEPIGKIALWNLKQTHDEDGLGLPGIRIQLSLFDDGYAISAKMAHVLGDASTLTAFVQRWATYNTGSQPGPAPLFDPSLVDKCMEQMTWDERTDEERLRDARNLPCHRYDWHEMDDPAYPSFLKGTTQNSIAFAPQSVEKHDHLTSAPWDSWDISRPVGHVQLHFSAKQLQDLKADALRLTRETDAGLKISTLDALLAYTWTLINRARYPPTTNISDEEVYLNCSLNARHRISTPLPDDFTGSTMFISHVVAPIKTFATDLSTSPDSVSSRVAPQLRHTLNKFSPQRVSDLLFSLNSEVVPQRLWQAFCGKRHTLVTSWLRLGIRAIDFGHGAPADVRAVVPKMDGIVQIMEAGGQGWNVDVYLECWERIGELMMKQQGWKQS